MLLLVLTPCIYFIMQATYNSVHIIIYKFDQYFKKVPNIASICNNFDYKRM